MSVPAEVLERLAAATLERAGCSSGEAAIIAHHLVEANLMGHDSHGVVRVPRYVEWVERGWLVPGAPLSTVVELPGIRVLDANFGFGQVQGRRATEIGIREARERGLALVALRHAGHLGRIGAYAEQAIEAGLVSVHFVNVAGSLLVAPFGATERLISTNPVAIGIPTGDEWPFVLDFATSLVAEGKVLVARQSGTRVREDALVDEHGRPTGDPAVLYGEEEQGYPDPTRGRGALRPFGEHKGSGLALACELLAGALTGSGSQARPTERIYNGMLSIFVEPGHLRDRDGFLAEVRDFLARLRGARPVDPVEGVLAPGDRERRTMQVRRETGIPLSGEVRRRLVETARRLGVPEDIVRPLEEGGR